jgi:hypothetical protein
MACELPVPHRRRRGRAGVLIDRRHVVQLLGQLAGREVGAEALVEEVGDLPCVPGDRVDELGDLADEQRAERGDDHDHRHDEDGEDRGGGQPSPPAVAARKFAAGSIAKARNSETSSSMIRLCSRTTSQKAT